MQSGQQPFLERVQRGPILCDGGMGTQIYTRGVSFERCFEQLNLSDAELIRSVHLDYIAAGAEIIETNTFGANRYRLREHGLEREVRKINRAGAKIAREARELSEQPVFIAGSIGPLGVPLTPLGEVTPADARAAFSEQAEALLASGVDLLILETISDIHEMSEALQAIRPLTALPIIASMTFGEDNTVQSGESAASAARIMRDLGADLVGVNCALGPAGILSVVEEMHSADPGYLLSAQPNAGLPRRVGNRFIYVASPAYFAEYTRRFLAAGVRLVGGCCGTTPQHIAAMHKVVRESTPDNSPTNTTSTATPVKQAARLELVQEREKTPGEQAQGHPTKLARLLHEGHFVVSAEMRPPRSIKFNRFLQNATYLRDAGVDLINIPDNAMALVRMNNVAAARIIQQQIGVETLVHFTPRDRNLMAVQSDLIGTHATDIRNVLAVTGDPPTHGDYPNATGIWDVDSIGLISILRNLNQGLDGMGRQLGTPASFFIACAATPPATDIDLDLERLHKKIESGAQLIMTQPVYDPELFINYFDLYKQRYGPLNTPILVGLQPLHSYQQAERFHNEVPGIVISEAVRERLRLAGQNASAEGLEIVKELLVALYPLIQGTYIMPLDRYTLVGELMPFIRSLAQDRGVANS